MYVCVYVCMYVCTLCMYVRVCVCMYALFVSLFMIKCMFHSCSVDENMGLEENGKIIVIGGLTKQ